MTNPFKKTANTAKETAKKWESKKEEASLHSRSCASCGAARPVNTNLANCAYCGYQFMAVDKIIKPEHKP